MNFIPNPVAFTIFGFDIRWYALCLVSGILAAFFIALKRCKDFGITEDDLYDMLLVIVPLGTLGARLYYVLFNLSYYISNPGEILMVWHGGLAIHGAIIGGVIGLYFVVKHKKLNFLKTLDLLAPSLVLAQAIGRWGNYFNMEVYGSQTNLPWAIKVLDPSLGLISVHPTFLYESIANFLIFLFLIYYVDKRKKADGEVIYTYLILYSIARFFIEGIRTDNLMFFGLRTAQIVSLILIIVGAVGLFNINKKQKEKI